MIWWHRDDGNLVSGYRIDGRKLQIEVNDGAMMIDIETGRLVELCKCNNLTGRLNGNWMWDMVEGHLVCVETNPIHEKKLHAQVLQAKK